MYKTLSIFSINPVTYILIGSMLKKSILVHEGGQVISLAKGVCVIVLPLLEFY